MRRAKTNYPVGATWEAKTEQGVVRVWLEKRDRMLEVWMFYAKANGYHHVRDWTTSRAEAVRAVNWRIAEPHTGIIPRLKRIK